MEKKINTLNICCDYVTDKIKNHCSAYIDLDRTSRVHTNILFT